MTERYAQASADIETHNLPIASAAVLQYIAAHDEGGGCVPLYDEVMAATGIGNRRTLAKALTKLRELGLIASCENGIDGRWMHGKVRLRPGWLQPATERRRPYRFSRDRHFYPAARRCEYCGGGHETPSEPAKPKRGWGHGPPCWPDDFHKCLAHIKASGGIQSR